MENEKLTLSLYPAVEELFDTGMVTVEIVQELYNVLSPEAQKEFITAQPITSDIAVQKAKRYIIANQEKQHAKVIRVPDEDALAMKDAEIQKLTAENDLLRSLVDKALGGVSIG